MEEKTQEEIKQFMIAFTERHPLGAIATASVTAEPSISADFIFVQNNFSFYFGTRSSTRKFEDIEQNPSVAMVLSDSDTLETLQIRGKAIIVMEPDRVRDLLETLRSTFARERQHWAAPADKVAHGIHNIDVSRWMPPVAQMREGSYVFYEVTPQWARFRRYDADWKLGKDYTEYTYTPPTVHT